MYVLTCGNDVEDAGLVGPLVADHVGAPAQQRPEVHVGVRGVGDEAVAGAGEVGGGRQQARGQGVVEGPGEGVGGGEAVDAAADGHRLVLGDAVHEVLGLVTHRGVCKQAAGEMLLCCVYCCRRLIGEVVLSRRRPLLRPSPG